MFSSVSLDHIVAKLAVMRVESAVLPYFISLSQLESAKRIWKVGRKEQTSAEVKRQRLTERHSNSAAGACR